MVSIWSKLINIWSFVKTWGAAIIAAVVGLFAYLFTRRGQKIEELQNQVLTSEIETKIKTINESIGKKGPMYETNLEKYNDMLRSNGIDPATGQKRKPN